MLRAGIIGLGVGEAHIAGYREHAECEVVAICDIDAKKLYEVGTRNPGIKVTESADEILNDGSIDIVSIASFDNVHHEQVLKAIANGKHVFVEKPLCLSEEEAQDIRKALKMNPKIQLSSNLILRASPRFSGLKNLIHENSLGSIYYLEGDYNYGRVEKLTQGWRGKIPFASVVYSGGVHIVDLFLWLTGKKVVEVCALGNRICTEGSAFKYNDHVVSLLRFEDGVVAKMSANFGCVQPHYHGFSVYGTKATFINQLGPALLYESRNPDVLPTKLDTAYPGVKKGALLHDFVDSVLGKSHAEVSADEVFNAMSVCFAIEKASTRSQWVKVNYI